MQAAGSQLRGTPAPAPQTNVAIRGAPPAPGPFPAGLMSGTPLDPSLPSAGSPQDIDKQKAYIDSMDRELQAAVKQAWDRVITSNREMQARGPTGQGTIGDADVRTLADWQNKSAEAGGSPGGSAVHVSVDPQTGQVTSTFGGAPGSAPATSTTGQNPDLSGIGGPFPAFNEAMAMVEPGMSKLQAQIPINSLIGQWEVKSPYYSQQLQSLLQAAHLAALYWDGVSSEPGANPGMAAPLQQLGDNMDAWTFNSLLQFQQQTAQLYQQE